MTAAALVLLVVASGLALVLAQTRAQRRRAQRDVADLRTWARALALEIDERAAIMGNCQACARRQVVPTIERTLLTPARLVSLVEDRGDDDR